MLHLGSKLVYIVSIVRPQLMKKNIYVKITWYNVNEIYFNGFLLVRMKTFSCFFINIKNKIRSGRWGIIFDLRE